MKRHKHLLKVFFGFILVWLAFLWGCNNTQNKSVKEHPNIRKLRAQSDQFKPDLIRLNDNVYVAVGFDGSNASMIIGKDGVVIVDALRSLGAAEKITQQFKQITEFPVGFTVG